MVWYSYNLSEAKKKHPWPGRQCTFGLYCESISWITVPFWGVGKGELIIAAAPILLFFTPYPNYTCFWLSKSSNVWRTFVFWPLLLSPENPQKIPGYLRPTLNKLYQARSLHIYRYSCIFPSSRFGIRHLLSAAFGGVVM